MKVPKHRTNCTKQRHINLGTFEKYTTPRTKGKPPHTSPQKLSNISLKQKRLGPPLPQQSSNASRVI